MPHEQQQLGLNDDSYFGVSGMADSIFLSYTKNRISFFPSSTTRGSYFFCFV